MNPVPAAVGAPRTPLVDLLPPEIEMRRKARRSRRLIAVMVFLFFALLAVGWFYIFTARMAAEADLAAEQERTEVLQEELATYDYIPVVRAALENAVNARALAGSTDITWATQLNALLRAAPSDLSLVTLAVSGATPSDPVVLDGTPFEQPDLGQLYFSGHAGNEAQVVLFQEAVDALPAFRNTYITSISLASVNEGEVPYWTFTGSTRITANALSGRTETEQELVTPSPSASPSAESEG